MFVLIFSEITYDDFKKNINDNCAGSQNDSLDLQNSTLESIPKHNISKKLSKYIFKKFDI